jgi:hypothetical protein
LGRGRIERNGCGPCPRCAMEAQKWPLEEKCMDPLQTIAHAPRIAQQPGQSQLHPCRALRPQRACVGSDGGWWWGRAGVRDNNSIIVVVRRCGVGRTRATTRASERTRSVEPLARISCLSMSFKATGRPVAIHSSIHRREPALAKQATDAVPLHGWRSGLCQHREQSRENLQIMQKFQCL